MKPLCECRLYTFIDHSYLRGRSFVELTNELCDGGSDIIQFRAKSLPPSDIQRTAKAIVPIVERAGVHLVINDHRDIAMRLPHPFVHLGQEDFFDAGWTHVSQLRRAASEQVPQLSTLASQLQLGLSTHAPAQALRAIAAGADYIAIGPVFATGTKPKAKPVTLEFVRWAAANVRIPWFAIGGITLQNLDEVLAAGARRICVVSAILNAPNVSKACQEFKQRIVSAPLYSSANRTGTD